MLEGLDIFIGAEALIGAGLAAGGGRSRLGARPPPSRRSSSTTVTTGVSTRGRRAALATSRRFPRHAALKAIDRARGVPIREDVRAPLRSPDEPTSGAELLAAV